MGTATWLKLACIYSMDITMVEQIGYMNEKHKTFDHNDIWKFVLCLSISKD